MRHMKITELRLQNRNTKNKHRYINSVVNSYNILEIDAIHFCITIYYTIYFAQITALTKYALSSVLILSSVFLSLLLFYTCQDV